MLTALKAIGSGMFGIIILALTFGKPTEIPKNISGDDYPDTRTL